MWQAMCYYQKQARAEVVAAETAAAQKAAEELMAANEQMVGHGFNTLMATVGSEKNEVAGSGSDIMTAGTEQAGGRPAADQIGGPPADNQIGGPPAADQIGGPPADNQMVVSTSSVDGPDSFIHGRDAFQRGRDDEFKKGQEAARAAEGADVHGLISTHIGCMH